MKLFSKKIPVLTVKESLKDGISENHISKKKKNTYCIKFSPFYDATLFCLCQQTPLGVEILNGAPYKNDGTGMITCHEFPNPAATQMAANKDTLKEILGEKISTTIIEYLDKETNNPVLLLFPHYVYVFDKYQENYLSHLNHATRRDFHRQLALREKLFQEHATHQK